MPLIGRVHSAVLAAPLVFCVSTVQAQTIRGTVTDSSTSTPVPEATVELLRPDSQRIAREQADLKGQFRLRVRDAGSYVIRVRRIGFRPFETRVNVTGDTTLRLIVAPNPVELATLGVTANMYPYLKTSGFLDRMAAGSGTFITPTIVEQKSPKAKYAVDLMEGIPGVRLQVPSGSGIVRVPYLRSCRSDPRRRVMTMTGLVDTTELGNVYPNIYVDGAKAGQDVFGWLLPTHVLAIEIFMGPAEIPLQYGGTGAPCGVILIWTKR